MAHTLQDQLRGFAHPACEAMGDVARLTHLVRLANEAADKIDAVEAERDRLKAVIIEAHGLRNTPHRPFGE